jgi:hypothetical protein
MSLNNGVCGKWFETNKGTRVYTLTATADEKWKEHTNREIYRELFTFLDKWFRRVDCPMEKICTSRWEIMTAWAFESLCNCLVTQSRAAAKPVGTMEMINVVRSHQ